MKITLIGASGFVGTRLITLLKKAQRYEMLNIDLQQSRFFPEVTAIGDVRDQDYLDKKLEGAECVVLLAAQHRDDVVPVSLYYDTNVGGIEKTLKAMEKNNIKRIIFFGCFFRFITYCLILIRRQVFKRKYSSGIILRIS